MKVEINYPKLKKEVNKFLIFRKIMLIIFLISIITCTIVNSSDLLHFRTDKSLKSECLH